MVLGLTRGEIETRKGSRTGVGGTHDSGILTAVRATVPINSANNLSTCLLIPTITRRPPGLVYSSRR